MLWHISMCCKKLCASERNKSSAPTPMKRALNYIQKLAAAASRSVKYFMLAEPSPS